MQNLKRATIIAGTVLVLGSIGTFMGRGSKAGALRAADSGPTVTIGAPLPVPTTAAQSGAWNVGITGTPGVNVANSPTVKLSAGTSVNVSNLPASPVPTVAQRGPLTNVGAVPSELVLAVWSPMQPCASGYVHSDGSRSSRAWPLSLRRS